MKGKRMNWWILFGLLSCLAGGAGIYGWGYSDGWEARQDKYDDDHGSLNG